MEQLLKQYSEQAQWLKTFDYQKVQIKPLPFFKEGIIVAAYLALINTIYIAPDQSQAVYFGTLIHELYHAYQKHSMGLLKYTICKIFNRSKLQEYAKEAQLKAVQWYGDMQYQRILNNVKQRTNNA